MIVSSCGWTPLHDYYGGKLAGWAQDRYMPRIRERYGLDPDRVPFESYEVVAALAPRAFFSSSPLHDDNFAVAGVKKAETKAREIFALLRILRGDIKGTQYQLWQDGEVLACQKHGLPRRPK